MVKTTLIVLLILNFVFLPDSYAGNATWTLDPASADWNTAANWTPATVPNGPADVATFGNSNVTDVTVSASSIQVAEIVFDSAAATSFNITCVPQSSDRNQVFTISGAGLTNSSAFPQALTSGPAANARLPKIKFTNAATAGSNTILTANPGGADMEFHDTSSAGSASLIAYGSNGGLDSSGGGFGFYNNSTAATANFTLHPASRSGGFGSGVGFYDQSTADHATFVLESPTTGDLDSASVGFSGSASAGNAVFTLVGPMTNNSFPPAVSFTDAATATNAVITVNGGQKKSAFGCNVSFSGYTFTGLTTSAGNATIINNGGNGAGSYGGGTSFSDASTAGEARLVANGGTSGGPGGFIHFIFTSDGGQPQVEVYDNGYLDLSYHDGPGITIGSLAGTGFVYTGSNTLTIGANNLSTTFSGIIQTDGGTVNGSNGSITKLGTGTLTLNGASTYEGGTPVTQGILRVRNTSGSATGPGTVLVTAGTLGGSGIIAGATTIGDGNGTDAFLAPGIGASKPTALTIQKALTFQADSSYTYKLNTRKAKADQVIANGVTIEAGAQFDLNAIGKRKLITGQVFTVVNNTSANPINGSFANLADGSIVTIGNNRLQASYNGGDGNDLTLTVVP